MNPEFKVGDLVYVVQMTMVGGSVDSVTVVEGPIESLEQEVCRVRLPAGVVEHPFRHVFTDRERAEERRFAVIAWLRARREVRRVGEKLARLPSPLAPADGVITSGNPLRIGEPNVVFSAQSNAWGKQDSAQKVLQRLSAIFEDIEHLEAMLSLIPHGTEYAKRLTSKYIILELRAASEVLAKLASLDEDYGKKDYPQLLAVLSELDGKYKFKMVRNKLSAHRDGNLDVMEVSDLWARITRRAVWSYFDAFAGHLALLAERYPVEMRLYFELRGKSVPLFAAPSPDFRPFDPPADGLPDPFEASAAATSAAPAGPSAER